MSKIASIVESNIFKYPAHIWAETIIPTDEEFHVSLKDDWLLCRAIDCYDCPSLCKNPNVIKYLGETHPNLKVINPELFV